MPPVRPAPVVSAASAPPAAVAATSIRNSGLGTRPVARTGAACHSERRCTPAMPEKRRTCDSPDCPGEASARGVSVTVCQWCVNSVSTATR
jgi:hypothetical protein